MPDFRFIVEYLKNTFALICTHAHIAFTRIHTLQLHIFESKDNDSDKLMRIFIRNSNCKRIHSNRLIDNTNVEEYREIACKQFFRCNVWYVYAQHNVYTYTWIHIQLIWSDKYHIRIQYILRIWILYCKHTSNSVPKKKKLQ